MDSIYVTVCIDIYIVECFTQIAYVINVPKDQLVCASTLQIDLVQVIKFINLVDFFSIGTIACFVIEIIVGEFSTLEIQLIDGAIVGIFIAIPTKVAIPFVSPCSAINYISPISCSDRSLPFRVSGKV